MLESQSKFVPRKITSIAKDLERFFQSKAKILPMKSDDDIEVALPSRLVDTMKGGFPSTFVCLGLGVGGMLSCVHSLLFV